MTPEAPARWTRPDFSKLTILIVEDDVDSRELLCEVLRICGAGVAEADNTRTAKEFVTNRKFDLIVTDLAVPDADGAMFLKWLRQQPSDKGRDTVTIAVTGYYQSAPLSGWAAYFQKPIDIEEFVRTIADIFKIPMR